MRRPVLRWLAAHPIFQMDYSGWPEKDRSWMQELPEKLGARKFRLFLSAWCRDLALSWLDKGLARETHLREYVIGTYLSALDVNDRYADTGKSKTALKKAWQTTFFRSVSGTEDVATIFDTLLTVDSLAETLSRCVRLVLHREPVSP